MCRRIFIMSLYIHEILTKVSEAKTPEEKVSILKDYNSLALRNILRGSFDESLVFILPEGKPPYREDDAPEGYTRSSIQHKCKQFAYFVKGGPGENLPAYKRERMFIEILEGVHPKEAEIVIAMKDKSLNKIYNSITKELVQEAFPTLVKS